MIRPGEAKLRAAIHRITHQERPELPETEPLNVRIFEILRQYFSVEELRTLCFKLGINYDELPADTHSGKARELVTFYQHRDELDVLQATIRRQRPDLPR